MSRRERSKIISMVKDLFVYRACVVIVNSTDNILISILLGTAMVGYYSNYVLVLSVVTSVIALIIQSVSSSIGNLTAKASGRKKVAVFYESLYAMQWMVSVSAVCLLTLLSDAVQVWLGEDFVLSNFVVICMVVNFYISNVINPVWMYREAMGLYRAVKKPMLCTALINLLLSVMLGKILGLPGILLATAIARLLTTFWYEPVILLKQELDTDVRKYYAVQAKNLLITLAISITGFYVAANFTVDSLLGLFAKALIVFGLTNAIYMLLQPRQTMMSVNRMLGRRK